MEDWFDALIDYEKKHGDSYGVSTRQNLIYVWDLKSDDAIGLFTKEQAYCLFKGLDMFYGDFSMYTLDDMRVYAAEWKEIVENQVGDASMVENDHMSSWERYAYYKYIYEVGYGLLKQA